ncbi:MAG: MerR family transcriptional regulator [Actinobacteria bacterium]|nr:MAG: MerR family transcriptional regulator [Actinomycetota bacterium]
MTSAKRVTPKNAKRVTDDRGLYVISVAAELAGVHPQTLRMYERKGFIRPERTNGNTRRYSQADIDIVRLIQELTQDRGMNLAGVEMVIELQNELERAQHRMERLRHEALELQKELAANLERIHQAQKTSLVLYRKSERPFGVSSDGR